MKLWGILLVCGLLLMSVASADLIPLISDPKIQSSSTSWDYEAIGDYEVYFNEQLNAGYSVLFSRGGVETQLLPHSLQFSNDLNQIQSISMPQSVIGYPLDDSTFFYDDGYGSGVDLIYKIDAYQVKEELVFANAPTPPAQYVIDGGNPVIELNFQVGGAGRIFLDGVEYDGDDVLTETPVIIKNLAGDVVYTLPVPFAIDSDDNVVYGGYFFKTTANKVYVSVRLPYSFFETASYPVTIDPTFSVDYNPVPAEWLIGGVVGVFDDGDFTSTSDITTGLSDNNPLTNYNVVKTVLTSGTHLEHSDSTFELVDYIASNNEIMATDFDLGTDAIESITICFQATENNGADARLSVGTTIHSGEDIVFPSGTVPSTYTCINPDPSIFSSGVNRIGLGCYANCGGSKRIWYDSDTTNSGNSYYWDTGSWTLEPHEHAVYIILNTTSVAQGKAISGHWNITYKPDYEYFLRLRKESVGSADVTIHAYHNLSDLSSHNVTSNIVGTGWFNVDVTSLVAYESVTNNLSFTELRFYTDDNHIFSELMLREEYEDNQSPIINSFSIDPVDVVCLGSTILTANITDNLDVQNATFTVDGIVYSSSKNGGLFTLNYSIIDDGDKLYDWSNIYSCDIYNQCTSTNPSLSISYTCDYEDYINIEHDDTLGNGLINLTNSSVSVYWSTSNISDSRVNYGETLGFGSTVFSPLNVLEHTLQLGDLLSNTLYYYEVVSVFNPNQTLGTFNFTTLDNCVEDWQNFPVELSLCRTNNTILQQNIYVDVNACGTFDFFPTLLNGTVTEDYCNYCDSDWVAHTGGIHDCQQNGTRYVDYVDYNSCYSVTGLVEDSPPLDIGTWVSCVFYINDFGCNIANVPFFKGKMEYTCELPYVDTEFKCLSVVSYGFDDVLQVNPQKTEKTTSLVGLNNNLESREYFTTSLGLLNAYYTNKNIIPDQSFTITTRCSDGSQTLVNQFEVNPELQNLDSLPSYSIWFRENFAFIFGGLVVLMIIALFSFGFIKSRGSYR